MGGEKERAITLGHEVPTRIAERDDPVSPALAYERLGRYLWMARRDEDAVPAYRGAVELMPDDPSEGRALVSRIASAPPPQPRR